ncbi:MAG: branched-chain amino acid ABC transporter permease [Oscillospiraceae bacterium]|nr:branched-chain amino acid ABC transporter permease [Oscillospiraceae bacterium]
MFSMATQLFINGLAIGAIYAMVGLGIALIFRAVQAVNFAQGEFVVFGGFFAITFFSTIGLPVWLSIICGVLATMIMGYIFQRLVYVPLQRSTSITIVVATMGVSIALTDSSRIIWGAAPRLFPEILGSTVIAIGDLYVVPQNLVILVAALILFITQYILFERTFLGMQMQAVAQDKETAALMGIKVNRMIAITFLYSSGLAAIAGILVAPITYIWSTMGSGLVQKAFVATIVGGFGSVPGAILGGLFVGVVETLCGGFISSTYQDAFAFIILIIVLIVRPMGFFGEETMDKA